MLLAPDGGGRRGTYTPPKETPAKPQPKTVPKAEPAWQAQTNRPFFQQGPVNMQVPAAPKPDSKEQRDLSHIWNLIPSSTGPTASPDTQTPADVPAFIPDSRAVDLLNQAGWTTPNPSNTVRTPDELLGPGERALLDYTYQINDREWQLIQQQYSTPEAKAAGFAAPASTTPQSAVVPKMKADTFTSAPMTWDQYEALSADQKAAVDFNTLLVEAREEDLSKAAVMDEAQTKEYKGKVEKIFGAQGGSERLAPKTVDLLTRLDFTAVGQDLDEFLSLERGITDEELKTFKFSDKDIKTLETMINPGAVADTGARPGTPWGGSTPGPVNMYIPPTPKAAIPGETSNYDEIRSIENMLAVDSTLVEKSRTMIETAMRDPNNALWSFAAATSGKPASEFTSDAVPYGFGNASMRKSNAQTDVDFWLQQAWEYMQNPANTDMAPLWDNINNPDPDMNVPSAQYFLDYINKRTRQEKQYGGPTTGRTDLRNPDLIRDLVGLE